MLNKLKQIDWIIVGILLAFSVFSPLVVWSATHKNVLLNGSLMVIKTIIFFVVGFIVMFTVALCDYRPLLKNWYISMGITVLLLVGLFFLAGNTNGAVSWYKLSEGLSFQPAELAKITLILALAQLLGRRNGEPLTFTKDLLPIGIVTLLPLGLVVIQPDLGNAIIYVVILIGMLWIGALKYRHVFVALICVAGLSGMLFVSFTTFNPQVKDFFVNKLEKKHWYERINTFINPKKATYDAKYQSNYAKIAIGSGGLNGDGYMEGKLKQRNYIPYAYSDSIFVVIGEEFGFRGAALLLLLYFLMIYRMILIAFQCYDLRGSYMVIGMISMFVFQIFENIGMMIGLMPITGITLPFISYGGTSLILNMIGMGLVMSIRIYQEKYQLEL